VREITEVSRPPKVLVTGAAGFAGSHFVDHVLQGTNWEIVATDSLRHHGRMERLDEITADWPDCMRFFKHDLNTPLAGWEGLFGLEGTDYIVAYASESHVDRSIADPVPFVRNNVSVALHTLELARAIKPRAVVWVSTDEVYGPAYGIAGDWDHPEWDPILPSNPYAASKAAQEAIAISYWRTYGVPLIIVNCMNMFGERQDAEKFVPLLMSKILKDETITIHGTEQHVGTRHYLHARNLASAIKFLLENRTPALFSNGTTWPDRYNVASPIRVSNLAMAKLVARIMGHNSIKYQYDNLEARPGHDLHYGLTDSKMNATGWKPSVAFHESLCKTVEWTLANPRWLEPYEQDSL